MAEKDKLAKLHDFLKHDVEVSFLDGNIIDVAMDVISKHIKMIKKLEKQNKRYREALEYIADNKIEHGWHLKAVNCVVRARRALEGESK